jgi:beta-phosphoglucomutase family hydrolase
MRFRSVEDVSHGLALVGGKRGDIHQRRDLLVARRGRAGPRRPGSASKQGERDGDFAVRRLERVLGLPDQVRGCLFDLDGVLTKTALVHDAAWQEMFDDFLSGRAKRTGQPFVPFDPVRDYDEYVDGRPRAEGTRDFLASRGIELPEGKPADPPEAETISGLGNRKNELVLRRMRADGVQVYEGSVRYVRAVRDAGLGPAVVTSSANCAEVLAAAGISDLFDVRIDGIVAEREHLRGKPAPDTFLAGARALGLEPAQAAVFDDALAGVEAGRADGFGLVVGVDRVGQAAQLAEHGADIVVADLAELADRP